MAKVLPPLASIPLDKMVVPVRSVVRQALSAVNERPQDPNANGKLGMVLQAHGYAAQAESAYARAWILQPDGFRWPYYLGLVQQDQSKCGAALDSYAAALRIDPQYLPARLRTGECLLTYNRWDDAGALFSLLAREHAEYAEVWYGLGRVQFARNDFSGAAASLRKACTLDSRFAAAHFAFARALQRLGKADEAKRELAASRSGDQGMPDIDDPLLSEVAALYHDYRGHITVGSELGSAGRLGPAADEYESALQIEPNLPDLHARLVYIYAQLGRTDKAERHFRDAIRLDPKNAEAYLNYGFVQLNQGDRRAAVLALRKSISLDPRRAEAHDDLGYVLELQGKLNEAAAEFRRALQLRSDLFEAHFSLGRILIKQGNFAEGLRHLLAALDTKDASKKPSYLYAVGVAFTDAGDVRNGWHYLQEAREAAVAEHDADLAKSIADDLHLIAPAPEQTVSD